MECVQYTIYTLSPRTCELWRIVRYLIAISITNRHSSSPLLKFIKMISIIEQIWTMHYLRTTITNRCLGACKACFNINYINWYLLQLFFLPRPSPLLLLLEETTSRERRQIGQATLHIWLFHPISQFWIVAGDQVHVIAKQWVACACPWVWWDIIHTEEICIYFIKM